MTVEAAIALISLVAVLALGIGGIGAVGDQLRCTDAAREAARLAARGEPQLAEEAVTQIAPDGARVELASGEDGITATVTAVPVGGFLPGIEISAEAFAIPEPGVDAARTESRSAGAER